MMTITEFCERHRACDDGRGWAVANCRDMNHAWETLRPDWLLWVATRPGVLDDRTLRMFAVWCARQVQHLMTDPRSLAALDVAERHAHRQATDEELSFARDSAKDAAWDARDAARSAAWAALKAAWAAARAAQAAAEAVARYAAEAAAEAVARDVACAATRGPARAAQAAWLRANAKPCFDGGAR